MSTPTPTQQPTCLASDQAQFAAVGPADELLDPERRELIAQLLGLIGETQADSIGWAFLWFADLSIIKELIECCGKDPIKNTLANTLKKNDGLTNTIKAWGVRFRSAAQSDEDLEAEETGETPTKKRRRVLGSSKTSKIPKWTGKTAGLPSETTSATARPEVTPLSPKKSALRNAKKLCRERDNDTCVLTGFREPLEVAHIYPTNLGKRGEEDLKSFWGSLRIFWAAEKVDAWKEQILGPDGPDTCSNLMCMVNTTHKLWEKARFGMKPLSLSEDQRKLTVQFYWLPVNKYRRVMPAIEVPSPFPCDLSSSIVNSEHSAKLYNINTDTKLCSGDILTFETDDPVDHPLPSMELLSMQWDLHRVLALSGAADATDEELDRDPDMLFGQITAAGVYEEDTEWDSEEEVEEEEGEMEEEEGMGKEEEAGDPQGVSERGAACEKVTAETSRLQRMGHTTIKENLPISEDYPGSRPPKSKDVYQKDERGQTRQEEQESEEESPLALGFRSPNIH